MSVREKPKVARSADCQTFMLLGDLYTILVTGEDSGGAYAWIEAVIAPGNGPPPHFHTRESEAFYILEGELEFMVEGQAISVAAGTILHVPLGVVHAFKNSADRPARFLAQTTPAGFEKMVAHCGQPAPPHTSPRTPRPEEIERLLAIAPQYGIQFPSPR